MSPTYGPICTRFHRIDQKEDLWLWPGRIPLGAITTLVGYGGEGKSFLACAIASAVSRGGAFPDGSPAPHGSVVIMAGEDLPAKLRQRYTANGAALERLTLLEGQRIYTKNGPTDANITLRDIDQIRSAIEEASQAAEENDPPGAPSESQQVNQQDANQNPAQSSGKPLPVKLLIVDPIGDFIPGINSDKDNEVRALLNPLAQLAKDRQLAVLLICHRKKGAGDRADNAALGSVAFTAKARAVHHVILDPHDTAHPNERRRLFLPGKLNDDQQTKGLAFKIVAPQGVVQFDREPVTHSADEVMQHAAAKSRADRAADPAALNETEAWLHEALKQGPRRAAELIVEARAEGIAARTLRTAKLRLGVTHTKTSERGTYLWQAPNCPSVNTAKPELASTAQPPRPPAATSLESQPPRPQATSSPPLNSHPAFPPHREHPKPLSGYAF